MLGDGTLIDSTAGQGDLMPVYPFNLNKLGLAKIGGYENIGANIEVKDRKGRTYETHVSTSVRFIKREERVAKKEGYKVMEKYALILFDFYKPGIGNYVSNANREDMIKTLRETADKLENNEDIPPTKGGVQ